MLCLLDQLATRLLTLSQATFLPARLPFLCETVDETDRIKEVKREKELTINVTVEIFDAVLCAFSLLSYTN